MRLDTFINTLIRSKLFYSIGRKDVIYLMKYLILYHINVLYRPMGRYRGGSHQITSKDIKWEITDIMEWSGKFLVYAGVSHDVDCFPY